MSAQKLQIVTWNCPNKSLEQAIQIIEKNIGKRPDILVIQEINEPVMDSSNSCCVFQKSSNKGVVIVSFNGYTLEKYTMNEDVPDFFIPVKINGPVFFNLLAVWTQKTPKYIESVQTAINSYQNFLKSASSVVLGDFNSNSVWDYKYRKFNHSIMVKELNERFDLVSSYHSGTGFEQGKEKHPTLYWRWNKDSQFHIDYCFVPKMWQVESVEIGTFEKWSEYSDHCPLIVDLVIN